MPSLARKIAEGTFIISASNLAIAFLGFFTSVILIRTLGVSEFGLLTLALSAYIIASILLDMGVSSVLIADVAAELGKGRMDRAKSLLWRYGEVELIAGVVLASLVFISSNYFEAKYGPTVGELVRISAVLLLFMAGRNILTVVFHSHTKFHYFSFYQVTESLSRLVYVILLVYLSSWGVEGAMYAYLFSNVTAVILSVPLLYKTLGPLRLINRAKEGLFFNTIRAHGKYVVAMNPLQTLNTNIPLWIIERFAGVEAVGVFSVALKLQRFLSIFLESLEQTLMPIVSGIKDGRKELLSKILNRTVKYSLWIGGLFFLLSEFLAPFAIKALFTMKYDASIRVFQILVFTFLFTAFNVPLRPIYFRFKAQKYLLYIYSIHTIFLLILGSVLTIIWGNTGMALVLVIGMFFSICVRLYVLKEKFDLSLDLMGLSRLDQYDREIFSKIMREVRDLKKSNR